MQHTAACPQHLPRNPCELICLSSLGWESVPQPGWVLKFCFRWLIFAFSIKHGLNLIDMFEVNLCLGLKLFGLSELSDCRTSGGRSTNAHLGHDAGKAYAGFLM
jgi:hypothetical protein